MTFIAGLAKADITHFVPGTTLFGWGVAENVANRVGAPLLARAMVLDTDDASRFVLVVCDLGIISTALRDAVEKRATALGFIRDPAQLMLAATHTHSGPSGYSEHLLFAASAPGFFPGLVAKIADGALEAIRGALACREPARLLAGWGNVPLDEPVAFNRALRAYNTNRDVTPVPAGREEEAVDRRMTVLRIESTSGRPLGLVSWFGSHGTTIHSDTRCLHPDHKGLAATRFEESEAPGFVAIFAQGAAGDVTPNHRPSPRGFRIGVADDDVESARYVADVQVRVARSIAASLAPADALAPQLVSALTKRDFFAAPGEPSPAHGNRPLTTRPPSLGIGFLAGTHEGPGWVPIIPELGRYVAQIARRLGREEPPALIELGVGGSARFFGGLRATHPVFRRVPAKRVRWFASAVSSCTGEWVPRHLPGQVVRIGALTLVGLPLEPTTIAAKRIEAALRRSTSERIVVAGYVNDYVGYLTTPEEFAVQLYEGSASLYGPAALGAWSRLLRELAEASEARLQSPTAR